MLAGFDNTHDWKSHDDVMDGSMMAAYTRATTEENLTKRVN